MLGLGPKKKPFALIILDGWGIAPVWGGNAIGLAQTKNYQEICKQFPSTALAASGEAVGLPIGSPGNSEAGHLNIGAGNVVHQDQPIIDRQIESGDFFSNKILIEAINHAKTNNSNLHLVGLLSKTGTHSHLNHLYALLKLIKQQNFSNVYIHLFGDGRDSDTMSGIEMAAEVNTQCREIGIGHIASIIGRYYAMDRDNRWDRVKRAYDLLTLGKGQQHISIGSVFADSYSHNITDEFIEPSMVVDKVSKSENICDNDAIILFNFRGDRARELTRAILDPNLPEIPNRIQRKNLYMATFVMHDESQLAHQVFFPEKVIDPIAKIWSDSMLRQYHTAETEKYAHVTYFFNGGREEPFPGEDRLMIPSPKSVKTYDKMPEMNAEKLTASFVQALKKNTYDCLVMNYANTDMVGHTGDLKATVKAVEYIDYYLGVILTEILKLSGTALVFSDHGNAEQMVNPKTGAPDTEHTTNLVPFVICTNDSKYAAVKLRKDCSLASIAPTVIEMMGLKYNLTQKAPSLFLSNNISNG